LSKLVLLTLDKELFILLRSQAIEVFISLLAEREFAVEKGLQKDIERINVSIAENKNMLSLVNEQLTELQMPEPDKRLGFFDTINNFKTAC
jgi:hypothetical protein